MNKTICRTSLNAGDSQNRTGSGTLYKENMRVMKANTLSYRYLYADMLQMHSRPHITAGFSIHNTYYDINRCS